MSLVALAVRLCTVRALMGQTLAGNAVEDSPIDPISVAVQISNPYIAVFTDTENNKPDGRSMLEGYHVQDLSLHIFLPTELNLTIGGVPYDFQGRESGAALVIDLIYRQIERVFMEEAQSAWSALWKQFVLKIHEVDSRAYVLQTGTGTGVRVPSREITIRCDTLFSPPYGAVPEGAWADLIAAIEAEPDLDGMGALITGAITGESLPQWRRDAAELGVSVDEFAGLGLGPLDGGPTDVEVPLLDVDINGVSVEQSG